MTPDDLKYADPLHRAGAESNFFDIPALVYTVGQVAAICRVAPRTVSKWCDSNRLHNYRIPGSQERRITRTHLLQFLKAHGMTAYTPVGNSEPQSVETTEQLIKSDIDETRELVAALPQELFDLRKKCGEQAEQVQQLRSALEWFIPADNPCICELVRVEKCMYCIAREALAATETGKGNA